MTWVRLDERFDLGEHWERLGDAGFALHVRALLECNRQLSDGRLTRSMLRRISWSDDTQHTVDLLVEAGLWCVADDGWELVGYLTDQLSKADILARRAAASERQRTWRDKQREERAKGRNALRNASTNAVGHGHTDTDTATATATEGEGGGMVVVGGPSSGRSGPHRFAGPAVRSGQKFDVHLVDEAAE